MDELTGPSKQRPVKNLRERVPVSGQQRPGIAQRVIRSLRPKGEAVVTYAPKAISICKVLYRDAEVIQEMRDQVTAMALRDENVLAKLKRVLIGQPLLSGEFTFDGLAGVDEFVLRPTAKWTLGAEVGADFELKWNLGKDTSIDNAILTLFAVMPLRSVSEVIRQVKVQRSNTPAKELIYPSMAISIWGTTRRKDDLLPKEIILHDERYRMQIALKEHNLDQIASVLKGRPLYVLGIVQSVKGVPSVKAGAVLLGQIS